MEHQLNADQNGDFQEEETIDDKGNPLVYKCHFKSCKFVSKRKDGLKIHTEEFHEKKLKRCENCEKMMTASSLSRHKRNKTCYSENVYASPTEAMPVDDLSSDVPITSSQTENSNTQGIILQNDGIFEVQEFKVETTFSLVTHTNGNITIIQNGIEIGGLMFYLTTEKPDGKIFLKSISWQTD